MLVKCTKFCLRRRNKTWRSNMHLMTIVHNTMSYLKFAKILNLKCSHHIQKIITEMMCMLISLIVVFILQCIHISK